VPAARAPLRWRLALSAVVLGLLAGLIGTAQPAQAVGPPVLAHAGVTATQPAQGSRVEVAPTAVSVRFSEAVGFLSGSLTVLGPGGERVDTGRAVHPDGDDHVVRVGLRPLTTKGSYLVTWRVVSADSHPGAGTFTFGYGAAAAPAPAPPLQDAQVGSWHALMRWLSLVGAVVLCGAAFFVSQLWPAGAGLPKVRRLLATGWWATVVGAVGLFALEGPYGAGLPLSAITDTSLVALTAGTLFGRLLVLRLVVLAVATVLWSGVRRGRAPGRWDVAGLGLLVVESFSFGGHAGQGDLTPVATTVDAVHLGAAAGWLGGLAVLSVGLRSRADGPGDGVEDLVALLPRWSRVARTCLAALALTGAYQAWRGVRAPAALPTTDYGRLLLVKLLLVAALLVVALLSHRRVVRGRTPARTVLVEVGLGAGVLAVTAVLVSSMPAWLAYRPQHRSTVTATSLAGDRLQLQLVVEPTRPGFEDLAVQVLDDQGRPRAVDRVTAALTEPDLGLGPIAVTLVADGVGGARAEAVAVPVPGRWRLTVYVRTTPVTTFVGQDSYLVEQ